MAGPGVHHALIPADDGATVSLPSHLGYLALALIVGGESLGLLLPGETAILTAGVLARSGRLELGLVLPIAAAAAIAGDGRFFLYNSLGGISWSATVALAGYALGLAAGAIFASTTVALLALLLALALRAAWRRRGDGAVSRPP